MSRRSQPAYDYDGDGCYGTPAIGPDGTLAPGAEPDRCGQRQLPCQSDLDNSQTYARAKCNNVLVRHRVRELLREGPGVPASVSAVIVTTVSMSSPG
ncbi:hypothetical protein GCM10018952_57450 [Streptosporangium vulgare]